MSTTEKDYYKILGLKFPASVKEVTKVYRDIAKKYHPDVCKDPSKEKYFKTITEAYNVLSKPKSKQEYDRNYFSTQRIFNNPFMNINDIQFEIFDTFQPKAKRNKKKTPPPPPPRKKEPPKENLDIPIIPEFTLYEIINEESRKIPFHRIINKDDERVKRKVNIKLENPYENIKLGQIIIQNKGNESSQTPGKFGNVILTIREIKHRDYERKGIDVYTERYLEPMDFINGTQFEFLHINKKTYTIKIPAGTLPDKYIKIKNGGIRCPETEQIGFLYIKIRTATPS